MTAKLKTAQPLYRKIEADILKQIRNEVYKPGEKIPSERALTKIYKASSVTIRQAISELVQRKILIRQHGSGTYVSENTTLHARNIGFIHCSEISIVNSFTSAVIGGVEKQCRESNYSLQVNSMKGRHLDENANPLLWNYIHEDYVNGLVLLNPVHPNDIKYLLDKDIPFVSIIEYRNIKTQCVLSDTEGTAYKLTRQLIKKGHKRIGFLTRPFLETHDYTVNASDGYLAGYKKALAEAGISFDQELIISESFDADLTELSEKAVKNVERFFDYPEPPTAILACNSILLDTLRRAAENRSKKIPADLSVVGVAEEGYDPFFTTVCVNSTDLGEIAADRLIRLINGETFHQSKVVVEFPLVTGKSVADIN